MPPVSECCNMYPECSGQPLLLSIRTQQRLVLLVWNRIPVLLLDLYFN